MDRIIGIDLGTTFSAVAFMSEDGAKLIPNVLGEMLTPSVVGIEPSGQILVVRSEKELHVEQPDRCVGIFKRYMGTDSTIRLDRFDITGGHAKYRQHQMYQRPTRFHS